MLRQVMRKMETGINRSRKVGALLALGIGLSTSAGNAFATTTDYLSFSPGFGSGWFYYYYGYSQGTLGSLTPNTTSDGNTINSFLSQLYGEDYSVSFIVTFSGTPNASWLTSISTPNGTLYGANATFTCPIVPNQCGWVWRNPYYIELTSSGTVAVTHQ